MRAMNLYLLTRAENDRIFSMLAGELSGEDRNKDYSRHEAQSLRSLVGQLIPELRSGSESSSCGWIPHLDGFFFSYTIAHISKEFDLLKISGDGKCILNIELKSEAIDEKRISKQLSQNRYYLTHISTTIYSFTYVMETNKLYNMNDRGYMHACEMADLAEILCKPAFAEYVEKDLDQFFRAADYLISPVDAHDKFLQGSYFLTNQQFEFKRRILEVLKENRKDHPALITVTGSTGTGKTLLLFDLALELSKRKKVLILLGGNLQEGHRILDERLKKVWIRSADDFDTDEDWSYILVDEGNRISADALQRLSDYALSENVPCIIAYDPRRLKGSEEQIAEIRRRIGALDPLTLEFTGNIRINRPIYAFLRALFNRKENVSAVNFDCIDVLCAENTGSADEIAGYYSEKGYHKIPLPGAGGGLTEGLMEDDIVGLEIDRVTIVLDGRFYYDDDKRLQCGGDLGEEALTMLYEGISRTREKLCLIIAGNEILLSQIMSVRKQ